MKRIKITIIFLIFLICAPSFAQEKVIANKIVVELGVISWKDIKKEFSESPRTPDEENYLKMIKAMAHTHGENIEDSYHIFVVLKDRASGRQINDAKVEVTAKKGWEKVKHKLQFMNLKNSAGYGQFFRLSSKSFYIFEVKISLDGTKRIYKVKFKKSLE